MRVSAVELFMGYVLVFIACCGVPSCYHHGQDQLVGVVKGRGEERNSVANIFVNFV